MPGLAAVAVDPAVRSRASVASWLGLLIVMLLSLNTLGGWVRLSGSGIAIPQWPLINGSLLPPVDDAGWAGVRADWERHQARLRERVAVGELSMGNLGRAPQTDADFKGMFLTEYGHRLMAALAGLVFAGCLTVVLRDPALRRRVGVPMTVAGALVIGQAALGGMLVGQGTNTHWLFLHQGNAACILACVLWSLLRLLQDGRAPSPPVARPALRRVLGACAVAAWAQLVLGALVAGSKFSAPFIDEFPTMLGGRYLPPLWEGSRPLAWNLLDNAWLHQWSHRWFAWVLVLLLACAFAVAARSTLGPRLRLALQVAATFVGVQIILGITSVLVAGSAHGAALPLAHQLMGMCLFCAIVLAWFDSAFESGGYGPPTTRSALPPTHQGEALAGAGMPRSGAES